MSWTVPTGCFYIAVRTIKPYTDPRTYNVYTYTGGETVTNQEHIPSTNMLDDPPIFLLADFDNGYIYTRTYYRTDNTEYPLFVIDASNQTVSFDARSMNGSYGVGSSLNICASQDALLVGSTYPVPTIDVGDFVFGNGTGMLNISAFPNGVEYSAYEAFKNRTDITSATLPNGVTSASRAFQNCSSLTSATLPNSITLMSYCFRGCVSLATAPTLPTGLSAGEVNDLQGCFDSCTSLTIPPVIPNGTNSITRCFRNCTSLTSAPTIPSSVLYMTDAFYNCSSLSGNVVVNNEPTSVGDIFVGTANNIYIIAGTSGIEATWENITSQYSNVHYEANDNAIPSLSMRVIRVDSVLSETQSELGEYAYINATAIIYGDYLPVGWTDSFGTKTLTKDGTTISPTWTQTVTDNTYTLKCWVSLGDIAKHTFTLQVTDDIKDANNTTKATHQSLLVTQSLSKAYKLVDYYHESDPNSPNYDTEGMAIGKFATEANLFDVDMPSRFRDSVTVDNLVGEIKMWAGNTAPNGWLVCDGSAISRNAYPLLFNAIGTLWGAGDGSTTFNLPNLVGRVPVGYDSSVTVFNAVGNTGGTRDAVTPYHNHSVSAFTISSGGGHSHTYVRPNITTFKENGDATQHNSLTISTVNTGGTGEHTHSINAHNTNYAGTDGNATNANLQPYAVVKYIICAI